MDFRNILITILATSITALIVVVFVFRGAEPKGVPDDYQGHRVSSGYVEGLRNVGSGLVAQVPFFFNFKKFDFDESVKTMSSSLEEARTLRKEEERYLLIEKVSLYENSLDRALEAIWDDDGEDRDRHKENLFFMSRTTARHLALWNPFFYYVHPEAQAKIFPLTRKLEEEHNKLLRGLADVSGHYAGEVATEDIELYIEDIGRSAARRNSDFIRFSYEDYLRYREFFDELLESYPDFAFGFADNAHRLFDNFYAMHEKVGSDYSDKTRAYIQEMRIEIRDMHKTALLQLLETDKDRASEAVEKTFSVISYELETHPDWREEVRAIMEDDYNFYNEIKDESRTK